MIFVRSSVNMLSSARFSRKYPRFFFLWLGKRWFSHRQENNAWQNSYLAGLHMSTFTTLPSFCSCSFDNSHSWHLDSLLQNSSACLPYTNPICSFSLPCPPYDFCHWSVIVFWFLFYHPAFSKEQNFRSLFHTHLLLSSSHIVSPNSSLSSLSFSTISVSASVFLLES